MALSPDLDPRGVNRALDLVAPALPELPWLAVRFEGSLSRRLVLAAPPGRTGSQRGSTMPSRPQPDLLEPMASDVDILPSNKASLAFHATRGYREIGRLTHGRMRPWPCRVKSFHRRPPL